MLTIVISTLTHQAALPPGPVQPAATLTAAGVDSMAIAVLAMILEEDHGLVISESDLTGLSGESTIAELAAFIEHYQAATA
ncbi:acyl carrier protein [Streptomyces sp. NPDC005562]|uniref:acyl carrier protein n=1 Tax=unclassified Streptomyces TaxID=2593676 RepID=UPI0033AD9E78